MNVGGFKGFAVSKDRCSIIYICGSLEYILIQIVHRMAGCLRVRELNDSKGLQIIDPRVTSIIQQFITNL